MKIRNGFVSNSSSSSFVMVGCEVTNKELDKLKEKLVGRPKPAKYDIDWEDDVYEVMEDKGWLYDGERDKPVVGRVLLDHGSDDGYIDDESYTMKELQTLADEVKKELGKEPKLLIGTRSC